MPIMSRQAFLISTLFIIGLIQYGLTENGLIYGGGYANLGDYPHHVHLKSNYLK